MLQSFAAFCAFCDGGRGLQRLRNTRRLRYKSRILVSLRVLPGETSPGLTVKVSFRAHLKKSITKRNAFLFNGRRGEGANKLKPGVQGQVSWSKGSKRVKNTGSGEKRKRGLLTIHGM